MDKTHRMSGKLQKNPLTLKSESNWWIIIGFVPLCWSAPKTNGILYGQRLILHPGFMEICPDKPANQQTGTDENTSVIMAFVWW